jgi:hypothetical protein
MKMVFAKEELTMVKEVAEIISSMQLEFVKAILEEDEEFDLEVKDYSFIDLLLGVKSKVFSAKLSLKGELTIEINPEFTVDFMTVYGKALKDVMPPAVALFKAVMSVQEKGYELAEKWFIEEEDQEN